MRTWLIPALAVCLLAGRAPADDAINAILDKAIQAHGGAAKLDKQQATRTKTKGVLDLPNLGELAFTQEMVVQMPNKFKESIQMEIMGQNINVVTAYNGKDAWVNANGMTIDLEDKLLTEVKEAAYLMELNRLTTLKDKKQYTLSPLGEIQVEGKPAVGVKIASKGHRDANFYFDKEKGLLVKVERQALDSMTMQDVHEERIILEYSDMDGRKVPKKVLVKREGKKFMEAEVLEVKFVDKVDDSEFAKP